MSVDTVEAIRSTVQRLAGPGATVRLFGSRLDPAARGGDVDLLVGLPELPSNPALLAARLSGSLSRLMLRRKVDVLLATRIISESPSY